jgi:ribosomal protein S18 acetylase RimI-like enzyme
MRIEIENFSGEGIVAAIDVLMEFRLRYFQEFPYLYVGTEDGERQHLDGYIANPTTRLHIARDRDANDKIVGVAIGTLLSTETEILRQIGVALQYHGIVPEQFYYFGEMIFEPEYRNRGIGRQMLEKLKTAGRKQGADRFGFLAVARELNDVRRPAEHVDSEVIFRKFGFEETDIFVTFEWPTVQVDGSVERVPNRLDLWIDG